MEKKAPTVGRIAVMVLFILSCFGIALFLWVTFGGPTPLKPEPYRIQVPFDEATQLADQADIRISGVSVGKVSTIDLPPDGSKAVATLDIDPRFAPLPADTEAILRSKTLLGETYVELTPGSADGAKLAEGAMLPKAQVATTVQLDEILRTFDAPTRAAFQTWMRDSAIAISGRGESLGNSFALLPDTFEGFERVFRTLDTQRLAVRRLLADGAVTFNALSERRGQLSSLVRSSDAVLETTARRNRELIEIFRIFPTFLDESRLTLARLRGFSLEADPLVQQLTPAAKELSPTLIELGRLAPEAEGLFEGLGPVVANAPTAFPAFRRLFRDDLPPLLHALDPFLRNANPLLTAIRAYRSELTALLGNAAAVTNGTVTGTNARVLRTMGVLGPESLAALPARLRVNRANPYLRPGAYSRLAQGLESFDVRPCTAGIGATLDPGAPADPAFNARTGGDQTAAQDLFDRLRLFAFSGSLDSDAIPAPGCAKQAPFGPFGAPGAATDYPHTIEQAP